MGTPTDASAEEPVREDFRCGVDDLAEARAALQAGFRFEGVARKALHRGAEIVDAAVFARVAGDPDGPVAPAFAPLPADGLTDAVVRLRELVPSDADALYEQMADALSLANSFTGIAPTRDEAAAMAARGGLEWLVGHAVLFAIVDVSSGRFAGTVRLRQAGPPGVGGIGYLVHPAFRGRGLSARALRLVVAWAFGPGGFARLELGAKVDNVASQRVALAAGFERDAPRVARLRNPDGAYADEERFYLINPAIVRRSRARSWRVRDRIRPWQSKWGLGGGRTRSGGSGRSRRRGGGTRPTRGRSRRR